MENYSKKYKKKSNKKSDFMKYAFISLVSFFVFIFYVWCVIRCYTPKQIKDHYQPLFTYHEDFPTKNIAVLTFHDTIPNYHNENAEDSSRKNKLDYCKRHGYKFIAARDQIDVSRPAAWSKFQVMLDYLDDYDYILWMDNDAIFIDKSRRIEDVILNGQYISDLYFVKDQNGINSGVFLVKNTQFSKWYLKEAYRQKWLVNNMMAPFKYEQRAIHYLHNEDSIKRLGAKPHPRSSEINAHTTIVDHTKMNSNVCEDFWFSLALYVPGCNNAYTNSSFIVHFAGKSPSFYRNWLLLQFNRF